MERKIIDEFGFILRRDGHVKRRIDLYIHDGCLIQKRLSPRKIHMLAGFRSLDFEKSWTQNDLIAGIEKLIQKTLGIDLKFLVKNFDTTEFKIRITNLAMSKGNLTPSLFTFDELKYHYETHCSLAFIQQRGKYLYRSVRWPREALKEALEFPYFSYGNREVNFLDQYHKGQRKCFAQVELVPTAHDTSEKREGAFRISRNPFEVLDSKGGQVALPILFF